MIFCHKCGEQMPDGSDFCRKCGTKLINDEEPSASSNTTKYKKAYGAGYGSPPPGSGTGCNPYSAAPPPMGAPAGGTPPNAPMSCPNCGSTNITPTTRITSSTKGRRSGFAEGCCGYVIFGPVGLLCGLCSQNPGKTTFATEVVWACSNCGKEFTAPPTPEELYRQRRNTVIGILVVCIVIFALSLVAIFGFIPKEYVEKEIGIAIAVPAVSFLGIAASILGLVLMARNHKKSK